MRDISRFIGVICAALLQIAFVGGCAPRYHQGQPLRHRITGAEVFGDSLSVQGEMNWPYAFTDYGLKVYKVQDDKGRDLAFRSFQIFWMNIPCFEIEFAAPQKDAQAVHIDVAFTSHAGAQRLRETVPINWRPRDSFATQLHRWERASHEP